MDQPPSIKYEDIADTAGFLDICVHPTKPAVGEDRDTLLHLVFFAVYTQPGRELLAEHRPVDGNPDKTREKLTPLLRNRLRALFPDMRRTDVIDMLVEAHFEGFAFAKGKKAGTPEGSPEMQNLQARYVRQLVGIMAVGFEDGLGHEFSMNW